MSVGVSFEIPVHTEAARIEQIARITDAYPGAILVGSMARSAITGGELSLNKGSEARDLDFTAVTGELVPLTADDQYPFPVDNALPRQIVMQPGDAFAEVRFDPRRPDVAVQLPGEVFAPYEVNIGGIKVQTFHPDTLKRVHLICDNNRAKDNQSLQVFDALLEGVDYTPLPESYFDPLRDLHRMVLRDPKLHLQHRVERGRYAYERVVPKPLQAVAKPVLVALKKALKVSDRKSIVTEV